MHKKINPNIFRVSIKTDWNTKFIEKKKTELNIFIFYKNEIYNFIFLFFIKYGLKINNFKLYYKKRLVHIFINYSIINFFQRKENFFVWKLINKQQNFNLSKSYNLLLKNYFTFNLIINSYNLIKIKFINKFIFINLVFKRINFIKFVQIFKFKFKNIQEIDLINKFSNKILGNLQLYLNNKTVIKITITQTIKNISLKFLLKHSKRKLLFQVFKFKKFEKINKTFKFSLNFINILLNTKKISIIIMEYLNFLLNNHNSFKNLNFFLKLFENLLKQFLVKFTNIKGILIILNGNLNKSPRAIQRVIQIGLIINNSKINNNIDFYKFTFFTLKGTVGSKIFIKY